jgi:hypothetical protein
MEPTRTSSDRVTGTSITPDLPLFRPEAITAQQHKFYGGIVLIHPFSLTFLISLAVFLSAAVLGLIVFGRYTPMAHVSGTLISRGPVSQRESLAILLVPPGTISFVRSGESVKIQCLSCEGKSQRGIVRKVSANPLQHTQIAAEAGIHSDQPLYEVTVALPDADRNASQSDAQVEADFPLPSVPVLKWLFESSPS